MTQQTFAIALCFAPERSRGSGSGESKHRDHASRVQMRHK